MRVDEKVRGHSVGPAVVNDLFATYDSEPILTRADRGGPKVEVIPRAA